MKGHKLEHTEAVVSAWWGTWLYVPLKLSQGGKILVLEFTDMIIYKNWLSVFGLCLGYQ